MKTRNIFLLALGIVLVVSILSVWFVPSVADFMVGNSTWNGVRTFKKTTGATIQETFTLPDTPTNAALIEIPYLAYGENELAGLKSFVEQGGTILLADDYGFGNGVLGYFGVSANFSGKPLLDPLFCYRNQWFPKITDFSPDLVGQNITQVILNHATALQNVNKADVIAWSSATSYLDVNGNGSKDPKDTLGPFPVAAKLPFGKGTLVLVADPSIMINAMIGRNDNLAFAKYLLALGGAKSQVYFDAAHLTNTPIDVSKSALTIVRETLAKPLPSLAILGVMFFIASRFLLKEGARVEQ